MTGVLLFLLARLLLLDHSQYDLAFGYLITDPIDTLVETIHILIPEEGSTDATEALAACLAIGILAPLMLNFLTPKSVVVYIVLRFTSDRLVELLVRQVGTGRPLGFTMDDGKVYIGLLIRHPGFTPDEGRFFELLPTLSGYREKETRRVVITTNYGPLIEAVINDTEIGRRVERLEDLQVLLPMRRVLSARLFDYEVFQEMFREDIAGHVKYDPMAPGPMPDPHGGGEGQDEGGKDT